jgi:hypothetical protein
MVMDPSTINTTNFTLKQGTTAITGQLTQELLHSNQQTL